MAYYLNENVHTHTFTPREYQVELLDSAKRKNTVICSSTSSAKAFIIIKLLQEYSWEMRTKSKFCIFILDKLNIPILQSHISMLTDLNVVVIEDPDSFAPSQYNNAEIVLLSGEIFNSLILNETIDFNTLVVLLIDDCLYGPRQYIIDELMCHYRKTKSKPRIVGLTTSLLGSELQPERLESELQRLEILLDSKVDTSSEIVTLIRLSCRPKEHVIECLKLIPTDPYNLIRQQIFDAQQFLKDHRFDLGETYGLEFADEVADKSDPKDQPLALLDDFLNILDDLGLWCADQAAFGILTNLEKLKVKTAYERHFLLFCMTSTVLISIRAFIEDYMKDLTDKEKVLQNSSPKILRFFEVLKQFKPSGEMPSSSAPPVVEPPKEKDFQHRSKLKTPRVPRRMAPRVQSEDSLCCLVFVNSGLRAKVLFNVLCVMSQHHKEFWWVSALYSVEKCIDPVSEPREAEAEHKLQEEVLRKYRSHDCNIMISTAVLENNCDLPKCNLVVRFDLPKSFHNYIQCKARARAPDAYFMSFANENDIPDFVDQIAQYNEVENTLLRRCSSLEPDESEEMYADVFSSFCKPYKPLADEGAASVSLSNSIAVINRYCAKLPSDTFTRLTPIWYEEKLSDGFVCTIRLPINSPVKQTITTPPMHNALLARRAAAFMICQLLHKTGELDDNLLPIGKENFIASEDDWNIFPLEEADEKLTMENIEPRPGTTKRRQYYYKKVANALLDCHPSMSSNTTYFYQIDMTLTCPLPEEQNTRGRKIYPPEESPQGFGILTYKQIPKISAFPIFTRSGEVSVDLRLCSTDTVLTQDQVKKIREFLNYTFTSVLRLQKYLMLFNPDASSNSYLIVPTCTAPDGKTCVDWDFIELIYNSLNVLPEVIPEENRKNYAFDADKYRDAVVMPWYRNQDQPQYFYVAEICTNLSPKSSFPGSEYSTFEEYYLRKYGIQIQHLGQHLLDVDHTSARLNFLTPRYVNRKGVALPTSSEETKRAKRENLEQKQILVPELCAIHPFSASLWRKAVCLPCILYRINALLLADQIRRTVAVELGLGKKELFDGFKWPPLNFGWTLSDVLRKSREEQERKYQEMLSIQKLSLELTLDSEINEIQSATINEIVSETEVDENIETIVTGEPVDIEQNSASKPKTNGWEVPIDTWSNDIFTFSEDPTNVRYVSPTSWMAVQDMYPSDTSYSTEEEDDDDSDEDIGGCRIEFTGNYQAEAVEDEISIDMFCMVEYPNAWANVNNNNEHTQMSIEKFHSACVKNKEQIMYSGILISKNQPFSKSAGTQNSSRNSADDFIPDFDFSKLDVTPENKHGDCAKYREANREEEICEELTFSFDKQPPLYDHPGPSPNVLLQALTMSNANDGINLERLETIGDSFLKYAITNYLYSKYENVHEGKLSHLRSKQVSNLNLYRLGKRKNLGEYMIATKFDPHDNWLPPCFYVPKELEEALFAAQYPANCWTMADMAATRDMTLEDICSMVRERGDNSTLPNAIPYNLVTQHSIPDKSIADCVEALIGAYLIECGPRGALLFMAWLGIRVLPILSDQSYGEIQLPNSPLLRYVTDPEKDLEMLLNGYDKFENHIGYTFNDRSYLLQALTHASYSPNKITDCYQRLEFLGDAVLDYLITRHLYEDSRMHSPGALTDLRSALVNNTIFASLAVRNDFHKYFRHLSPGLNEVVEKFIRLQEESGHNLAEELYLVIETESEEVEDVEVPKALGDVFESIAGAIFLDSGMSLDAVWKVYYKMMRDEIEQFSNKVPKSPIRELLELEPETAKFGKPEKLADGRRVRVAVEVFGKGIFKGIGRNYRIAKCTAAKCALKHLKRRGLLRHN